MKKKITIVEDNNVQSAAIALLLGDKDFEIAVANNIVDFYRVHKNAPDLIMLDDHLRLGFNNHLYHTLKQNPLTKNIPVILMADIESLRNGLDISVKDDFIVKPFNDGQLAQKIDGMLNVA
jgi:DNA-binding response OmpR family regulator